MPKIFDTYSLRVHIAVEIQKRAAIAQYLVSMLLYTYSIVNLASKREAT